MDIPDRAATSRFTPVIGLEVHVQLATASKMFCGCEAASTPAPNTRTCPVCLGLPGVLPVVNERAVDLAILVAIALDAAVAPQSVFARKNYFYPDLPKGYQITQHDRPLATGGRIGWSSGGRPRTVRLVRIHLEEDAGKSWHDGFSDSDRATYLDFNRCGVPLAEIVTEPDLTSPAEAAECFRRLRDIVVAIGASEGNLEQGSLRCDANVSVRRAGESQLGARTEIKNLNSFRFVQHALEHEIARQVEILSSGGRVQTDTRLWDPASGRTVSMRSKEGSEDYRYFPEPDLPPLVVTPERLARLRAALPELPESRRARLQQAYGLSEDAAEAMAVSAAHAVFFEQTVAAAGNAAAAATWIAGELARWMHEATTEIDRIRVTPESLGRLIRLVSAGGVSASAAKQILARMFETGCAPDEVAASEGLLQESDEDALRDLVTRTLDRLPDQVAQYRQGKRAVAGFLVGQVMKASGRRANPALVDRLVRAWLDGPGGG